MKTGFWSVNFDIAVGGENKKFWELSENARKHILECIKEGYYNGEIFESDEVVDDCLSIIVDFIKSYGEHKLDEKISRYFGPDEYYSWTAYHYHTLKWEFDHVEVYYDYENPFGTDYGHHCNLNAVCNEAISEIYEQIFNS